MKGWPRVSSSILASLSLLRRVLLLDYLCPASATWRRVRCGVAQRHPSLQKGGADDDMY